jgi:integrase
VFYNALRYAVELDLLPANPIDRIQWTVPPVAQAVDRRVVANPTQVMELLDAVERSGGIGPRLVAFFACLYYAALRPSEAAALRKQDCYLPAEGWGRLDLSRTAPHAGSAWTDDRSTREDRGLKRRARNATRSVPIPPQLVALLTKHLDEFGTAPDGRLFRGMSDGPLAETRYGAVWRRARKLAFTPEQFESRLAARPYDLRHAGVSLWLNAGTPPTEVAARAGHSVAVLLRVYAACLDGEDESINARITDALA